MNGDLRLIRHDNSTASRLYKNGFFDQKISDMKSQLRMERQVRFDPNYNGIIQPKFEYIANEFAEIFSQYGFNS